MSTDITFIASDTDAQRRFIEINNEFIQCIPIIKEGIEKAFSRKVDNLELSDYLIFELSHECADRFSEIVLLCGNGLGNGAFIILRSMFEYLVTARYIHIYPKKGVDFVDYLFVHVRTVRNQVKNIFGNRYLTDEYKEFVENNFKKVKEKFAIPKRHGGTKTRMSWADINIVEMAQKTGLGEFVILAYYLPIERAHPSFHYLIMPKDQNDIVASQALMVSHKLLIELFKLQQEHYGLDELKPIINQCQKEYGNAWKRFRK